MAVAFLTIPAIHSTAFRQNAKRMGRWGGVRNHFGKVAARCLAVSALALALAACGGGGGGSYEHALRRLPSATHAQPGTADHGDPATTAQVGAATSFIPVPRMPTTTRSVFRFPTARRGHPLIRRQGSLTGTPASNNIGTNSNIVISVSDGTASVSLPAFSIQVQAAPQTNLPPVISGTPAASIVAGQAYSFQPSASDPNGDTLTFSISGKPAWATFNTSTGRLNGTPGTG